MSVALDEKLIDFHKWYTWNHNRQADLLKQMEFQKKALEELFNICVQVAEDLKIPEGRKSKLLYLPSSMQVSGDLKTLY